LRQGIQETCGSYKSHDQGGKFGYTDYAVLPYVEVNDPATAAATGLAQKKYQGAATAAPYALDFYNGASGKAYQLLDSSTLQSKSLNPLHGGTRVSQITDGSSKTILVYEDTGRSEAMPNDAPGSYTDPVDGKGRALWRWAEPDCSSGCSNPINNNASPTGGPSTCPWTTHDCGPNNEWFSFHPGGAHAMFADGHVDFVSDSASLRVVFLMGIRDDGQPSSVN
jgi:prepilin-type processing-associated H-X9-DG protein